MDCFIVLLLIQKCGRIHDAKNNRPKEPAPKSNEYKSSHMPEKNQVIKLPATAKRSKVLLILMRVEDFIF
jgi:hypothetical protein